MIWRTTHKVLDIRWITTVLGLPWQRKLQRQWEEKDISVAIYLLYTAVRETKWATESELVIYLIVNLNLLHNWSSWVVTKAIMRLRIPNRQHLVKGETVFLTNIKSTNLPLPNMSGLQSSFCFTPAVLSPSCPLRSPVISNPSGV